MHESLGADVGQIAFLLPFDGARRATCGFGIISQSQSQNCSFYDPLFGQSHWPVGPPQSRRPEQDSGLL